MTNGVFILTRGGGRNGTSGLNGRVSIHLGILLVFFFTTESEKKRKGQKKIGHRKLAWSPGSTLELHIIYLNDTPACGHFFGFSFLFLWFVLRSRDRETGMRGAERTVEEADGEREAEALENWGCR